MFRFFSLSSYINGDAITEMGQNEAKADLRKEFKFGSGHVILRCLLVDWAVGCKSRILGRGPG